MGAVPFSAGVRAHRVSRGMSRSPAGRPSLRSHRGDRRRHQSAPRHRRAEREALRSVGARGHGSCRRAPSMARRRPGALGVVVLCGLHRHLAAASVRRPRAALRAGRRRRPRAPEVPWQVAPRGRAHRSHRGRSTHLRDPGGEPAESARLDPFPLHGRTGDESYRGTGVRRACPLCPLRAGRRDRDERGMPLGAQSRWPPTRAPRPPAPGAPGGLGRSARGRTGRRFAGEAGVPRPLRDLLGPRPGARPRAARVLGARQDRHPASRAARALSSRTSCWGQRRSSSSSRLRCPRPD